MISKEGRVKIADFGLAKGAVLGVTMTAESSVILGSVSYLSPEQVQRGVADARSDVYSLGITAFEIFTGKKPFEGEEPIQIAYMHVNNRVPRLSTIIDKVPTALDDLIYRATSANPDERPRDASIFHQQLLSLNPQQNQLSLQLDLPIAPLRPKRESKSLRNSRKKSKELTKTLPIPVTRESTAQVAKRKKISKRVKRNRFIALGLSVSLGIFGWYALVGPGSRVVVPSTVGATESEVSAALRPLGLAYLISERRFSEDIASGLVITSTPDAGKRIDPSGTLKLILSKGPERFTIPALVGLTPGAARTEILKSPLSLAPIVEEFNNEIPKGYVISSNPKAGKEVKRDTKILITVSKGVEQIALNSYIGKSSDQALNELVEAGFDVESQYDFSETRLSGEVISQIPDGGKSADLGARVELVISKGSEFSYIPNVFSLDENKAAQTLKDLGLKVTVKKIGKKAVKKVTAIAPKVGSKVKRGSTVTVTVG